MLANLLRYSLSLSRYKAFSSFTKGLSMFLFVSAFLGNVFYVASILTAPQMHLPSTETRAYLRESMPYD